MVLNLFEKRFEPVGKVQEETREAGQDKAVLDRILPRVVRGIPGTGEDHHLREVSNPQKLEHKSTPFQTWNDSGRADCDGVVVYGEEGGGSKKEGCDDARGGGWRSTGRGSFSFLC